MNNQAKLLVQIKYLILFFSVVLILSGITAMPVISELDFILNNFTNILPPLLYHFLQNIYSALLETQSKFPFLFYGYDWLAFAHIMIAIAFYGVYIDAKRNIWVVKWAQICSISIIPFAFIAGSLRGIPFYWQLIDCSFGIIAYPILQLLKIKINQLV